jgi:hypothetical protein
MLRGTVPRLCNKLVIYIHNGFVPTIDKLYIEENCYVSVKTVGTFKMNALASQICCSWKKYSQKYCVYAPIILDKVQNKFEFRV